MKLNSTFNVGIAKISNNNNNNNIINALAKQYHCYYNKKYVDNRKDEE